MKKSKELKIKSKPALELKGPKSTFLKTNERNSVCPNCFENIFEKSKKCPHCHEYVGLHWFNWPWFLMLSATLLTSIGTIVLAVVASEEMKAKKQALMEVASVKEANEDLTSENTALKNSNGVIGQVIKKSFELKNDLTIKFKMGGKTPEEGFDSSGFVAYLLAKVKVIDPMYYQNYSSKKLKNNFEIVENGNAKMGDLLFYDGGLTLLYLGGEKGIGIGNSQGIKIYDVKFDRQIDIRRWFSGKN